MNTPTSPPPPDRPDPPSVSAVVHGARWSDAARDALDAALRAVVPAVEILEAREDLASPVGAGALINGAARRARGETLLILPSTARPDPDLLHALFVHESDAVVGVTGVPRADGPHDDTAAVAALLEALDVRDPDAALPAIWLLRIRREAFDRLGGMDEQVWSEHAATDLFARARQAGLPEALLPAHPGPPEPAYPFHPVVRRFFDIRDPLVTAIAAGSPDDLGTTLAVTTARAVLTAWRAARPDGDVLEFGGPWRDSSRWRRWIGASRADELWPADETGTLIPLLAIDAALDELDARAAIAVAPTGGWPGRGAGADRGASARADASRESAARVAPPGPDVERGPPRAHPDPRLPATDLPCASVIVVNWNGRAHLPACFSSILASDYPPDRLEVICADNGSTDGSRELLAREFPRVKVVALPRNEGFTGGNRAGVAQATGEVLVFLNNDMRVERDAVRRLVGALDDRRACAAARVLSWDGRSIDFVRGTVNFEGRGFQERYGEPVGRASWTAGASFFPNGGAFAVRRDAYDACGGFDDRFFAYYDDVDLGWRLRLAGFDIGVAPDALVYHRHGATSRRQPSAHKRYLLERNGLWVVFKCYGVASLRRTFGAALALAVRRIVDATSIRTGSPIAQLAPFSRRCRSRRPGAAPSPYLDGDAGGPSAPAVHHLPMSALAGAAAALRALPAVLRDRESTQRARRRPDSEVLRHLGRPLEYTSPLKTYARLQDSLADVLELPMLLARPSRVLVITHEPMRPNMSGPGIRVLEMGRALGDSCTVTIATPAVEGVREPRSTLVACAPDDRATMRQLAAQADVAVIQGFALTKYPFLRRLPLPLVADLYCPFTLEYLEMTRAEPGTPAGDGMGPLVASAQSIVEVVNDQLRTADFFICASERQRDFWIGALHAAGRVNPLTYGADPSLRALIDVVPFGVPEGSPRATGADGSPVLKGRVAGIAAEDRVLLWGGSIVDWQDPETAIRAVARLAARGTEVRLFFMGTRHPNPDVPVMRKIQTSIDLARELGVLGSHVFFNDWVPYADRGPYLTEADVGITTHHDHLETRYAFRTRMLDYVWAGLPVVCTEGDYFAALVRERKLGLTVPPGDDAALADAIGRLLDDRALAASCARNLRALAADLRWPSVVAPLRRFCERPHLAPDREPAVQSFRDELERGYRWSKWARRTVLGLGVSEARFERFKQLPAVRALLTLRNQLAMARAGSRSRARSR